MGEIENVYQDPGGSRFSHLGNALAIQGSEKKRETGQKAINPANYEPPNFTNAEIELDFSKGHFPRTAR